jgi:hypothetical protein
MGKSKEKMKRRGIKSNKNKWLKIRINNDIIIKDILLGFKNSASN